VHPGLNHGHRSCFNPSASGVADANARAFAKARGDRRGLMVLMALVTTLMTTPLLALIYPKEITNSIRAG
jgi:hypothetical protein